ncbi:hypothetical protein MA16_Dca006037 [Dendrobium catenatum]|uniref:Uncharacterized protein n=1 Tax=Dendrobium catenatum TaxID=906689 RepID=A0A2I0WK02_9ASPA|nr:hypothetical protein MA16_Dca006037 [Dendrobium catenatum]
MPMVMMALSTIAMERLQPQCPLICDVQCLMRFAAKMLIVIIIWKPILSMPQSLGGAIFKRWTSTDWLAKLMPRRMKPRISMRKLTESSLRMAPTEKVRLPPNMSYLRSNTHPCNS